MHWYWHDLVWDCYTSFFPNLYQNNGPLFTPNIRFRSISWELVDIFSPNFIYALILTRSSLGLLHVIFLEIVIRVIALYLRQNFVSAQYLENHLVEFHQILYMHSSWQDLAWDCYTPFFAHLYQSYDPLFMPKFRFRSICWELTDIFSPNFIIRSYWQDQAWDWYTSFLERIYIDMIYLGIVTHHFIEHLYRSYSPWFAPKF